MPPNRDARAVRAVRLSDEVRVTVDLVVRPVDPSDARNVNHGVLQGRRWAVRGWVVLLALENALPGDAWYGSTTSASALAPPTDPGTELVTKRASPDAVMNIKCTSFTFPSRNL